MDFWMNFFAILIVVHNCWDFCSAEQEIIDDYKLADEICKKAGPLRSTLEPPYVCVCSHGYTRHDGNCVPTKHLDEAQGGLEDLGGGELERLRQTAERAAEVAPGADGSIAVSESIAERKHNLFDLGLPNNEPEGHFLPPVNSAPTSGGHHGGHHRQENMAGPFPVHLPRDQELSQHDGFSREDPPEKYSFEFPIEAVQKPEYAHFELPAAHGNSPIFHLAREQEDTHPLHNFGTNEFDTDETEQNVNNGQGWRGHIGAHGHLRGQGQGGKSRGDSLLLSTLSLRDQNGHVVSDKPMKMGDNEVIDENNNMSENREAAEENESKSTGDDPVALAAVGGSRAKGGHPVQQGNSDSMAVDMYFLDNLAIVSHHVQQALDQQAVHQDGDQTVNQSESSEGSKSAAHGIEAQVAKKQDPDDVFVASNTVVLLAVVAACSIAGMVGLIVAGVCWYRLQRSVKATAEAEYPAYGVTGLVRQGSEKLGSPGDRKLAQSAQMYHYQHQKQQMLAMEKANSDLNGNGSDVDSEEENEEGDYTVYECPGLAPTGEMEVKNPLFNDDTPTVTGVTPGNGAPPHYP